MAIPNTPETWRLMEDMLREKIARGRHDDVADIAFAYAFGPNASGKRPLYGTGFVNPEASHPKTITLDKGEYSVVEKIAKGKAK